MSNHNWLKWPAVICFLTHWLSLGTQGQSQNAIGAHRAFEKTSFSCVGRPSGYYADIETGCQVYHMCDGLGRQFSYSCPNTTLFQQRMLICDHWYMVNCSKAESDYAANLLIGQRDKPFVNDEETNLRTPRPDLLDRPYAPDYSGESFRNQYKQFPAVQNQIHDNDAQKGVDKSAQTSATGQAGRQRWKIPPPSRLIEPPAFEPHVEEDSSNTAGFNKVHFVPTSTGQTTTSTRQRSSFATTTTRRPTTSISRSTNIVNFNNAALHQRQRESLNAEHDDLGTSHSTRYNTSADLNSAEVSAKKPFTAFGGSTSGTKVPIKVPSKIYEPPFLYPIYNQNDTFSTTTPLIVSTAAPFRTVSTARSTSTTSTTTRAPIRPTTLAGRPFTASNVVTTTAKALPSSSSAGNEHQAHRFDSQRIAADARTPAPAHGFRAPTSSPVVHSARTLQPPTTNAQQPELSALDYKIPATGGRLDLPTTVVSSANGANSEPAKELLPPYPDFIQHDVATTQGPPIYYEWKVPSNGLEPPKLDPPIGVDGREYPDAAPGDLNSISLESGFIPTGSINDALLPTKPTRISNDITTTRTPSSRSIKQGSQPNSIDRSSTDSKKPSTPLDYTQLRKELSLPEVAFPLESIGRTGYLSGDTYNSFQLKIPERRSDKRDQQHWFGENPKCPECHPSYVVPGTCSPCLRR